MDNNRYLAQELLLEVGSAGQDQLKRSKVLVVGCGGLASSVLPYLAAAGVGEITLMDDDVVSLSNLNRQVVFTPNDIGFNKAIIAKQRLQAQNPELSITAVPQKFNLENGLEFVRSHDIVLDCCDNYQSKVMINYCCIQNKTPFVFASVLGWDGQVALLSMCDDHAPCYKCWQELAPQNEVNCGVSGVLGAAVNMVGSLQALLTLQYLLGYLHNADSLFVFDLWNLEQKKFKLDKRDGCKFHHDKIDDLPVLTYLELKQLNKYTLCDVRSLEEWEKGHLPNARRINPGKLLQSESYSMSDGALVVYCNQETLSRLVVENLLDLGCNAYVLSGGYRAYCDFKE